MLAAARMIVESNVFAKSYSSLASTGIIRSYPGCVNTVPGEVQFSLDVRASENDTLEDLLSDIREKFTQCADGCEVQWTLDFASDVTKFDGYCISCVTESCRDLFGDEHRVLTAPMHSGAGENLSEESMLAVA